MVGAQKNHNCERALEGYLRKIEQSRGYIEEVCAKHIEKGHEIVDLHLKHLTALADKIETTHREIKHKKKNGGLIGNANQFTDVN